MTKPVYWTQEKGEMMWQACKFSLYFHVLMLLIVFFHPFLLMKKQQKKKHSQSKKTFIDTYIHTIH